jgi:hypothetical protein
MNHSKTNLSLIAAAVCTLGVVGADHAAASTYSTNFENFSLGGDTSGSNPLISDPSLTSNNWRGNGSSGLADNGVPGSQYDGEIVNTGTPNGKAYRLSNAKVSGNYDATHASTPILDLAGESSTTASLSTFRFSLDFKSAVNLLQEGLVIDVTPFSAGTADRQGILRITDDATNGFSIGWWEVKSDESFNFVTVASGLARDSWHNVEVTMDFVDGDDNDSVTIDLNGNGSPVTGLKTWENADFYTSKKSVDGLIFRVASPADYNANTGGVAALDGYGVFFDNLTLAVIPEPASLSLLALGGLAMPRRRRDR